MGRIPTHAGSFRKGGKYNFAICRQSQVLRDLRLVQLLGGGNYRHSSLWP